MKKSVTQTRPNQRNKLYVGLFAVLLLTAALIFGGIGMTSARASAANVTMSEDLEYMSMSSIRAGGENTTFVGYFITAKNNVNTETTKNGILAFNTTGNYVYVCFPKSSVFSIPGYTLDHIVLENTMYGVYRSDDYYVVKTNQGPSIIITYCYAPEPIALPADPVKEGHHFVGWYYDEAFTQAYDGEPIYADTQLYAKFEINKYAVTYNSAGGTAVDSTTVDWNTVAPMPEPTRTGYNFVGWFGRHTV